MISAMRTARPTGDVDRVREFYEQVVGLPVLWTFVDHDGFDGVIFGVPNETSQLELVKTPHFVEPTPSIEDALVLYCEAHAAVDMVQRLRSAGARELLGQDPTLNPYWERTGAVAFVDPDGYRLIVARS